MPPSIFVSVAAYRDPELQHTLVDLFTRARHPERIEVGVAWESVPGQDAHCLAVPPPRPAQVRMRESHAQWSRGAAAARFEASRLYDGEDYAFEIDSHMRFADDWDVRLVEMHRRLPSEKAVLSTFPPDYAPPDARVEGWVYAIGVKSVRDDGLANLTSKAIAVDAAPQNPLPGAFLTPRCLFGPGAMLDEVAPDPFLFHFGEDLDRSVRLWTHGYDIYHPHRPVAWHRWTRAGRVTHFEDHPDWPERNARSVMRLRHKLGVAAASDEAALVEMASYGTGEVRSLADHAHYSGYDPAAGTADERARDGRRHTLPPEAAARVAASGVPWVTGAVAPTPVHAPRVSHASDDFVVMDDFLPPDVFARLLDHCRQMDYKHINTTGKVSRVWRVRDGFPLRGMPDVMRVVAGDDKTTHALYPTGTPFDALAEALEAAVGDARVSSVVGRAVERWDRFSLTSWIYPRETGLSLHHDGTAGYTGAYAFFLTPDWDPHWGGLLLVFEGAANAKLGGSRERRLRKWIEGAEERAALVDPGIARCVLPVANRVVFIHPEAHHLVTTINAAAGDRARISVAGFFSRASAANSGGAK